MHWYCDILNNEGKTAKPWSSMHDLIMLITCCPAPIFLQIVYNWHGPIIWVLLVECWDLGDAEYVFWPPTNKK